MRFTDRQYERAFRCNSLGFCWEWKETGRREISDQNAGLHNCTLIFLARSPCVWSGGIGDGKFAATDQLPQQNVTDLVDICFAWR